MSIDVEAYGEVQEAEGAPWKVLRDEAGSVSLLFAGNGRGISELVSEEFSRPNGLPSETSEEFLQFLNGRFDGDLDGCWFCWLSSHELEALDNSDKHVSWENRRESAASIAPGFQVFEADSIPIGEHLAPFFGPIRRPSAPTSVRHRGTLSSL